MGDIVLSAAHDLATWSAALEPLAIFPKPFDLEVLLASVSGVAAGLGGGGG